MIGDKMIGDKMIGDMPKPLMILFVALAAIFVYMLYKTSSGVYYTPSFEVCKKTCYPHLAEIVDVHADGSYKCLCDTRYMYKEIQK